MWFISGQRPSRNRALHIPWISRSPALSYRYVWGQRALQCDYPERFVHQALAHNSKAAYHAYSKHAEVTVPCLDDWEKQWKKNPHALEKPKVVAVDDAPQGGVPPTPRPPSLPSFPSSPSSHHPPPSYLTTSPPAS